MIYRFRATIPESKVFFRIYEVDSSMNLYAFHNYIISNLGFVPDQMVFFEAYGKDGKMTGQYALFNLGDGAMDQTTFEDVISREQEVLHYVFDMRTGRNVRLEFLGEGELNPRFSYPCLVDEKGVNPDQFSAKYEDNEPVAITPSKKRSKSDEDLDDEDFDDDDEDFDDDDDFNEEDEDKEEEELLVDEDFGK